jgi:ATP/maltotriose-dependent transcriptional regulator MalT/DNA-binding SARP family transcriptional activator
VSRNRRSRLPQSPRPLRRSFKARGTALRSKTRGAHRLRPRKRGGAVATTIEPDRAGAQPTPGVLRRPRLESRLDESFGKQLTSVVAGAGYGKTTALATWTAELERAWYTVTPADVALPAFAKGIVEALGTAVPGLGSEVVSTLAAPGGSDSDELVRAQAIAAVLAEELRARLLYDLVLVLDDVHEFGGATASGRLIESLCRQAPPTLHVVLASRTEPAFAVGRLRGEGRVLELGAQALAFDLDEVAAVLALSVGEEAADAAEAVLAATGGWPAAVKLAVEFLRSAADSPARDEALRRLTDPRGPLLAYVAQEVFARERPEVAQFLSRAAHLDGLSVELCEALGVPRAAETIGDLVRRGLFIRPRGDGGFVLHTLIGDFARERWPLPQEDVSALRKRAGAWFEQRSELEQALRSYAAASDFGAVARLLRERGGRLLADGAAEAVATAGDLVPRGLRDSRLEALIGQAHWVRGHWDAALACLERAAAGSAELPPGLAWRIGAIHHLRADPGGALRVYGRGRLDGSEPDDEALLLAWTASAQWLAGDADACRRTGARAVVAAHAAGNLQALATAHIALAVVAGMDADRSGHAHFEQALEAAQQVNDVLQMIRIRVNWQMPLFEEGRYAEALDQLEDAIRLAELTGFSFFHALALRNRAETFLAMGRLDESIADGEAALAIFRALDSDWAAIAHAGLGDVYATRGDLALARAAYEVALDLGERSGEKQALVGAMSGLARVLVHEDPEEATSLARRALALGPWWGHVDAVIASGWVALACGDRAGATEAAAEAAAIARRRLNPAGIARALELQAFAATDPAGETARLEEALAIWRTIGNPLGEASVQLALARLADAVAAEGERAERRLLELGVRIDGLPAAGLLLAVPPRRATPILVRTLGAFSVVRDGRPVALAEWQSRKSRDLLKLLVARRGRPATREFLMETLWPGEEPAKLSNRLSVALSTLRSVLDPERRHASEHYVRGDGTAVSIANVSIDLDRFLREAEAGLAGERERLVEAESLYTGDFLEEDVYEDWPVPLREDARAAYVAVTRALAEHALADGKPEAAGRYLRRILERDPYDESAHVQLVGTLAATGRHGEARRCYRLYTARMDEIGVEAVPFPSTRPS